MGDRSITVTTGHGYGPVTLTFDYGLSADGLHAEARDVMVDGIGEVIVFAYAPNAGDPRDEWNRDRFIDRLDAVGAEFTKEWQAHWATPLEFIVVPANDVAGLAEAAQVLTDLYVSFDGMLDPDEWEALPKCPECGDPSPEGEVHEYCR